MDKLSNRELLVQNGLLAVERVRDPLVDIVRLEEALARLESGQAEILALLRRRRRLF